MTAHATDPWSGFRLLAPRQPVPAQHLVSLPCFRWGRIAWDFTFQASEKRVPAADINEAIILSA